MGGGVCWIGLRSMGLCERGRFTGNSKFAFPPLPTPRRFSPAASADFCQLADSSTGKPISVSLPKA